MMSREEIFGREEKLIEDMGKKGCGYMGKVVSYPGGRYEEMGSIYIDLTSPHCMLVLGKRGTGKSYTLGVMAENFANLDSDVKENISVIMVDTMSVFHGLKTENTNDYEVDRLKDFNQLSPRSFGEEIDTYMPKLALDTYDEDERPEHDHLLQFPLNEVGANEWLSLFGLDSTDPVGTDLMKTLRELKRKKEYYDFNDLYEEIDRQAKEETKDSIKNYFQQMESLKIFTKKSSSFDMMTKGGKINILDMSYLGRLKGYDVRNLLVSLIAEKLLKKRTLFSTLEMQAEAGMLDPKLKEKVTENPIVYMIIDEGHLFLPAEGKTIASDVLIDWVKLGRHPGLSLILATQEPSALHESAIRQSDLILSHNLTSHDDIEALGKARQSYMKKGKDIQSVVSTMEFKRGLTVIFDDKTRKMEMCRIRPRMSLHTGMDASALPEKKKDEDDRSQDDPEEAKENKDLEDEDKKDFPKIVG